MKIHCHNLWPKIGLKENKKKGRKRVEMKIVMEGLDGPKLCIERSTKRNSQCKWEYENERKRSLTMYYTNLRVRKGIEEIWIHRNECHKCRKALLFGANWTHEYIYTQLISNLYPRFYLADSIYYFDASKSITIIIVQTY